MRQQRFIIEFSDEEVQLAEMFAEIRESSEYRSGKPGVLQLFTGITKRIGIFGKCNCRKSSEVRI